MMSFRNLDLNLLRVFDAVMTEQNLTRAASSLAMTQPAVSNALRRLRDALNDELVVRTAHGVRATARAEALWPTIRQALSALEQVIAPGTFDPARVETTFRLAMADSTAALFLPSLVRSVECEAPGISVHMVPLTTRDPRPMLVRGEIDLAVGFFPKVLAQLSTDLLPASLMLRHQRLYSGKYVCVMRRDHKLAGGELTLDAFCEAHHLQVSFSGRAHGLVDEALNPLGRKRRVLLTVNQYFTAGKVIASSDLITVLPYHLIASTGMSEVLTWKALPFDLPEVHVDMFWHGRDGHNLAHQWLREHILAVAEPPGSSNVVRVRKKAAA